MFEERKLDIIKNKFEKLVNLAYELEDLTNYDIKELGRVINILQRIDIEKEYEKYHKIKGDDKNGK
jgi:hypothetical protein